MSSGVDNQRWLSQDGGLTWGALGQQPNDGVVQVGQIIYPDNRSGSAYRVGLQSKLGHLFSKSPEDFLVNTWFKRVSLGFFSQDTIMSQGQTAWGTDIRGALSAKDALRLRYDGIINEMPLVEQATASRALHREMLTLAYERKINDDIALQGTYGFGYIWDEGTFPELSIEEPANWQNHLFGLGATWRPMKKLGLFARQEYYAGTYPVALYRDEERLVAHLGADYQLTPGLSVGVLESIRFDGENHLSLRANWASLIAVNSTPAKVLAMCKTGGCRPVSSVRSNFWERALALLQNTNFKIRDLVTHIRALPVSTPSFNCLSASSSILTTSGYKELIGVRGTTNTVNDYTVPGALTDGLFFAAPTVFGGGDYLYGAMSRDSVSP